ncbi:IS3 family transposase [Paludisphaera sp. Pla2]|uniref:IS3 family transposase n=1 Tax=Paludisphaera mucosa TaxID=3030827 RepID=A0ABT6FE49_9BACT|nr:IS3 family transposase [Paludisphaera mucosa]MDG3005844.1 IS3 family transposase [Paludisphaera mucosa]
MGACLVAVGKLAACLDGIVLSFIPVKKSDGLLRRGVVVRYDFVERRRGRWPVRTMCRVLRVSPGGFHGRRGRPSSARALRSGALVEAVRDVHGASKARYGSPRAHAELADRGVPCCVDTAAKLMRRHGIAARAGRKFRRTTDSGRGLPVAENILGREFEPGATDRAWAADVTYVPTGEGRLYLAAVEDLHPRRIVGWSMPGRNDGRLAVDALEMAVARRPPGEGLVAHSDRGSAYASGHYRRILARRRIACSMSRRANCRDDAPMESFFASLKKERTTTSHRRSRCRRGYNRVDRVSVGLARPGPLL